MLTSEQMRAARSLIRWDQKQLAEASKVSVPTIKRLEGIPGPLAAQERTVEALRVALEAGGVIFLDEGAEAPGGAGVRLRT